MTNENIITNYNLLIGRAKLILEGAPFFTTIFPDEFCRIQIEDETAVVIWPEVQSGYYNSCSIENQSKSFPSYLLNMDLTTFQLWKKSEKEAYDKTQLEKKQLRAIEEAKQKEAFDRATFERLREKYKSEL